MYKEERDLLEKREIYECDMEEFSTLESSEKTIAILGDRWWPQKAKQEGDKANIFSNVIDTYRKKSKSAQILEVSIRSRHGAPSRKGCVVNGQMTKASNK